MKFIRSLCLLVLPIYFFACTPQTKIPNYLENITDSTGKGSVIVQPLLIQKNDQLSIQVYSASTRPELSDAIYNLPAGASAGAGQGSSSSPGFLVDDEGNIEYPRIGVLHAEGLTKKQLGEIIKRKINEQDSVLTNPSVIIRFQNLKVTVLGEVNKPGVIAVPGEKVNIMEAIGLAGGLTDFGVKTTVKVVREQNGVRETGIVDLSSKDLFNSPYYILAQNDLVLIDPTKKKAKKADQDVVFQRVSFGLSIITAIALLYNIFK